MTASRTLVPLAFAFALTGCGAGESRSSSRDPVIGGTLVVAAIAEPRTLLPQAMNSTAEKQIVDQIFDYLAEIGPDLGTVGDRGWIPRLADSWAFSADSLSIAFHLNPGARWHDGLPVRSSDVRFSLDLFKDPRVHSIAASSFDNVDSVSVRDSLTAVVWFKKRSPEQFFQIAYNLIVTPEHLLRNVDRSNLAAAEFARHPIGSGPFRFVQWTPRQDVEVEADTMFYRGRPRLDRVIWSWNQDAGAAATRVLSGEADLLEFAPLEVVAQATTTRNVRSVPYPTINYSYLLFNMHDPKAAGRPHPLFAERAMRLALSMALDRTAMRKNVFDSLGVVGLGPFTRFYATADTTVPQIQYDSAGAARLLDSLGWHDTDGDGVRDRRGVPLRFSLMVPTSSISRRRYAVLIQEQMHRVGVRVEIDELDPNTMQPRMLSGQFDALLNNWSSDPAPSAIRQSWHTGPTDGGNFGGYANARLDAVVDSAVAEFNVDKARALYQRAYRLIIDDAPAVWLFESRNHALIHTRLRPVVGGSDLWWRDIRLWWIPPAERIARDKIGLVAAAK